MAPTTAAPQFQELAAPASWRAVEFFSDLHLQASEPETVECLRRYLHSTDADALFMLGDVFEVWVGDDACDEPGSFEAECAAVLTAAARQRPLFFMHGNRDFLLGTQFLNSTGITGLADPTLLVFGTQRVVLSHGDLLCLGDVEYQRFRQMARSDAWQQAFLAMPLAERRAQARSMRAQSESRKQTNSGVESYADVDHPAALDWLHAAHATTLVHGHTHCPAAHNLAPGYQRVVLSDWDAAASPPRADVLRLSARGLERRELAST